MTLAKIFEFARSAPERTAIHLDGQPISYRDFARRIMRMRAFLVQQDLPPTEVMVVCISDAIDCWCALLALSSLGHTTACIGGLPELKHIPTKDIGCVLIREGEPRPALQSMIDKLGFRHVVTPEHFASTAETTDQDDKANAKTVHSTSGGHLIFTSGTTGTIKKVQIDAGNEAVNINQRLEAFEISKDSIVNLFEWARWSSVGYTVPLGVWSIGASVVLLKQRKKHESLAQKGITHAIGTPDMAADMLASVKGDFPEKDKFRLYLGGGPLPQALAQAILKRITQQLHTMVGSTEAGVWCVTPIRQPQDTASHVIAPSRIVEVVDDDGKPVAAGETGEVRIRQLENTSQYFGDAEATEKFFRHGYFYPGDLGVFDENGRLTLQGRVTDIVYVKGMKLAVGPLERAMQNRLGGLEVCIFSTQIGRLDEELWVAIQGNQTFSSEAMKAIAAEELKRFPRVRFCFMPEFPKNDRGKVMRNELKEKIFAESQR